MVNRRNFGRIFSSDKRDFHTMEKSKPVQTKAIRDGAVVQQSTRLPSSGPGRCHFSPCFEDFSPGTPIFLPLNRYLQIPIRTGLEDQHETQLRMMWLRLSQYFKYSHFGQSSLGRVSRIATRTTVFNIKDALANKRYQKFAQGDMQFFQLDMHSVCLCQSHQTCV